MFPHTRISSQLLKRDLTPPLLASLKCEHLIIPGPHPTQVGAPHGASGNGQPAPTRKSACLAGRGLWVITAQEIVAFRVLLKKCKLWVFCWLFGNRGSGREFLGRRLERNERHIQRRSSPLQPCKRKVPGTLTAHLSSCTPRTRTWPCQG